MRETNPFESPQSNDSLGALRERLIKLHYSVSRQVYNRDDIARLLEEGKTEEFQKEIVEWKIARVIELIVEKVRESEDLFKTNYRYQSKESILKSKTKILKAIKTHLPTLPYWEKTVKKIISDNHLNIDVDMNFDESVLEEAWIRFMGSV